MKDIKILVISLIAIMMTAYIVEPSYFKRHSLLDQLTWSTAGHTINTSFSLADNNLTSGGDIALDSFTATDGTGPVIIFDDVRYSTSEKAYFRDSALGVYSQADGYLDGFADTGVRIGNSASGAPSGYTMFDNEGEITLVGSARVKKEFQITATDFVAGGTAATQTIVGNYPGWAFTIGDEVVANFRVPKDWDSGSNLDVIIFWAINEDYATSNAEVQWRGQWFATPSDSTESINSPIHSGAIDYGDQNIPATAYYLTQSSTGSIASASLSAGDLIGVTLDRVALDGGVNPTAEPIMLHVGIIYTINKLGESL